MRKVGSPPLCLLSALVATDARFAGFAGPNLLASKLSQALEVTEGEAVGGEAPPAVVRGELEPLQLS
jgi:hypothetical protein